MSPDIRPFFPCPKKKYFQWNLLQINSTGVLRELTSVTKGTGSQNRESRSRLS